MDICLTSIAFASTLCAACSLHCILFAVCTICGECKECMTLARSVGYGYSCLKSNQYLRRRGSYEPYNRVHQSGPHSWPGWEDVCENKAWANCACAGVISTNWLQQTLYTSDSRWIGNSHGSNISWHGSNSHGKAIHMAAIHMGLAIHMTAIHMGRQFKWQQFTWQQHSLTVGKGQWGLNATAYKP